MKKLALIILTINLLGACVSSKKYDELESKYQKEKINGQSNETQMDFLRTQNDQLQTEMSKLRRENNNLRRNLAYQNPNNANVSDSEWEKRYRNLEQSYQELLLNSAQEAKSYQQQLQKLRGNAPNPNQTQITVNNQFPNNPAPNNNYSPNNPAPNNNYNPNNPAPNNNYSPNNPAPNNNYNPNNPAPNNNYSPNNPAPNNNYSPNNPASNNNYNPNNPASNNNYNPNNPAPNSNINNSNPNNLPENQVATIGSPNDILNLQSKLQQTLAAFDSEEVQVATNNNQLMVRLSDAHLYQTNLQGEYIITDKGKQILSNVANFAAAESNLMLLVEGQGQVADGNNTRYQKSKAFANFMNTTGINYRFHEKNNVPLAFNTSGTQTKPAETIIYLSKQLP